MNADHLSYNHTRESEKGTGGPGQESQRIRAAPPDWLRGQSGSWTTLLIYTHDDALSRKARRWTTAGGAAPP